MGFCPGYYVDTRGVERHIEQKSQSIRFYLRPDEMGECFDLAPEEARKLANQLLFAAHLLDDKGI